MWSPKNPKPTPKVRQSVAEMKEALSENIKAQKMGACGSIKYQRRYREEGWNVKTS